MERTGRNGRISSTAPPGQHFIYILLLLVGLLGMPFSFTVAQDVEVNATVSANEVLTGNRLSVSIEISGSFSDVSRPQMPPISGLRLLNQNPSTSRSFTFVNGESKTTYSYTYYLMAEKEGTHTIPPITVKIDGRAYQTEPINIRALKREDSDGADGSNRPNIFVRMEVSDENPVPGQQLLANVVLYFKENVRVNSYQPVPGWKAEGFWKEQLERTDRPKAQSTILNGVRYRKARLMQYAVFPTKSGELTLSPFNVKVSIRTVNRQRQSDPFSSFFGGFGGQQRTVDLETEPVDINVKELAPPEDALQVNAVGSFTITRNVNSYNTYVGETIEVETVIEGVGNIPLISKPEYEWPSGLEIYDPKEQTEMDRQGKQIAGKITYTDVLIPRNAGTYTIPAAKLAHYSTGEGEYKVRQLDSLTIEVEPSPVANDRSGSDEAAELVPMTGLANWESRDQKPMQSAWWFWIGAFAPLLLLIGGYWQKIYRERLSSDSTFARYQKAWQRAESRLKQTNELAREDKIKEAYGWLHGAISGYAGDKLGLPEAGLSDDEYMAAISEHMDIAGNDLEEIRKLLNKCSTIQYAPNYGQADVAHDVEKARKLLKTLRKKS